MPLTKRQFDLGVDEEGEDMMRQVYELLAAHSELAYSLQEIQVAILGQGSLSIANPKALKVQTAVEVLVGIGAVDQRTVGEMDYFAFLQEFDIGTWMSAKHFSPPRPPSRPPRPDS